MPFGNATTQGKAKFTKHSGSCCKAMQASMRSRVSVGIYSVFLEGSVVD